MSTHRIKPVRMKIFGVLAISTLAAAAMMMMMMWFSQGCTSKPERPSLLFIVVDTLRADHLGCFGYPRDTSPNIDRLALQGVRFERATAQSSWTLPSMISLMSGRRIFSKVPKLPDESESLAELMKQQGYQTAAFVANSLVGEKEGFTKGFDHYEVRQHLTPQWSGRNLNERLLPWMRTELRKPFFLYLHYLDPHFPYEPPKELAQFSEDYDPITQEKRGRFADFIMTRPELADGAKEDIQTMREQINLYDGEIRLADRCVGEVMDELKKLGIEDETVVVLTSDHGECLWDHPHYPRAVQERYKEDELNLTTYFFRDHSYHLFEEFIHVPLIFKGPGIPKNRTVREAVENVDLLPTFLALSGDERSFRWDGRSLLDFLTDPETAPEEERLVLSHCNMATCAIQGASNLKLVVPTETGSKFGLVHTLFDLEEDPAEWTNRLDQQEGTARYLLKAVEEWRRKDYFKDKTGAVDAATREKMRELGYAN